MKRLVSFWLLALALLPRVVHSTDAIYINNGLVTFPPQIDAITFINNGTFNFTSNLTLYPFDTSNTQNFTNNGTMRGGVGFQFDNAPATAGVRKPSANFRNRLTGSIMALDVAEVLESLNEQPFQIALLDSAQLLISATNIINEGTLIAGAAGLIRLVGDNVNLARSGLLINPIVGLGSFNEDIIFTNYYIPDVAIYDEYWGQGVQQASSDSIIRSFGGAVVVSSPPSDVEFRPIPPLFNRVIGRVSLGVLNPVGDFYTNTLATTNLMVTNMMGMAVSTNVPVSNIVQAVFIGLPPAGADWGVRFFPSEDPQNPMRTVSVGISLFQTNVVTVGQDTISLYLVDNLASSTNRGILTNFTDVPNSRPRNYRMQRREPIEFFLGSPGNGPFSTNLLYMSDFVSPIVTNEYAAYSAFVDNIASRPPNIPAGTPTNFPGRIEIHADTLDMTRTRLRANGILDIKAKHLISSSNAIVDSENLSFNLASTNGFLRVQNLAKESVARLQGTNYVWSGFWTNYQNMLIENYVQDTVDTNLYILTPVTNVVDYRIYCMIFDASGMQTELPVVVNDFLATSTNVIVNDSMTVVENLLINGDSFTLNGSLTLSNKFFINNRGDRILIALENWVGTNAPNLRFFTNNGTLRIPSEGHFGDDLARPYSAFANTGLIDAFGVDINSDYVEITGQILTSASLNINGRSIKIDGGTLNSGGDIRLLGNDLRLNRTIIQSDARLDLSITNSLSDAGATSGNSITTSDGFRLLRKPTFGDLLGTTFDSTAPPFAEVDHLWAAADFGASSAGFQNNAAIGTLVLTPGAFESSFPPLFFFEGVGGGNALYVDLLDLSQLSDFQNEIAINPDLVIYFASARLSFTPPLTNGAAQLPEEYLDGQFNGHLRWVRDFAGPNSSVDVLINGQTVRVNRALRNSRIIDSDGDGIPNFFDSEPFNSGSAFVLSGSMVKTNPPPAKAFLISWPAAPNRIYRVEYTTNPSLGNWQVLCHCTNNVPTNRVISVWDTNVISGDRRFYRVGYGP
jgi:hypothetical protein